MRKVLFTILAILAITTTASAHKPHTSYHGEVNVGMGYGLGNVTLHHPSIHTIQGMQIGECLSVGIGLGVDVYMDTDFESVGDYMIPIYADFKAYAPTRGKVDPFIMLDIGGAVSASDSGLNGLMISTGVGFRAGCFIWSVGYHLQQFGAEGIAINTNAIQLKLGFAF